MELEPGNPDFEPVIDRRLRMDEPLPVKLVTVEDARLEAPAGLEKELDAFYVWMLEFEKEPAEGELVYRAENFRLRVLIIERPAKREDLRALGVEVKSLTAAEHKLIDREMEYERQKGTTPGHESLLVNDPAGNPIELV